MWSYKCYVSSDEPNLWAHWYASNEGVQGAHDSVFEMLEQMPSWAPPNFKKLTDCDGLCEVIFKAEKAQYRVFGFFNGERTFTVVGMGTHKQKVYTPRSIIDTCIKRMKEIRKDQSLARECIRPVAT